MKLVKRPTICEDCGSDDKKLHGHHDDYAKPDELRYLCVSCHTTWHMVNGQGLNHHLAKHYTKPKSKPFDPGHWIMAKDVAEMLFVSTATLCRWRQEGFGPSWCRLGPRTIRYEMATVEQWMQARHWNDNAE